MPNFIKLGDVQGYIIDVANMLFERSDGKAFLMQNASSTSTATSMDNVTISNGWLSTPQLIVDTTRTTTITYTTNMTDAMLIAGVNNIELTTGTATPYRDGAYYTAEAGTGSNVTFTIQGTVTDLYIDGFEQGESVAAGKFTVTAGSGTPATTVVTMLASDVPVGTELAVIYTRAGDAEDYVMSYNSATPAATGKLTCVWPLYAAQDEGSAINAYLRQVYPKVKVTQVPGLDNSYKSEGSASIEFTSMAQRSANAKDWYIIISKNA